MALEAYDEKTAQLVIDFYTVKGFNKIAIISLLANLYAESKCRPNNLQNSGEKKWNITDDEYTHRVDAGAWLDPIKARPFRKDGSGYGIVQWTSEGRKGGLEDYAHSKRVSISDASMQVEYSYIELTSKSFKEVYEGMLNATGLRDCTILIMRKYEKPASKDDPDAQNERVEYAEELYKKYFGGTDMSYAMTASTFLSKLKNVLNYKTLYVHGCFGAPMNTKYKERYKNNTSYNRQPERQAMIDAAEPDRFGFDCIGLIKAIAGNWSGSLTANYGGTQVNKETNGISYGPMHMPDYSANGLFDAKTNYMVGISKDFSKIKPGAVLHMDGHVGVYLGDGQVIECTPKWKNCVQLTNLGNIGNVAGNYRVWSEYGYLPFVDYSEQPVAPVTPDNSALKTKINEVKTEINKLVSDLNELEALL